MTPSRELGSRLVLCEESRLRGCRDLGVLGDLKGLGLGVEVFQGLGYKV